MRIRQVRTYMCRKVIWAQVLNVGVSLSAGRYQGLAIEACVSIKAATRENELSNHHPVPTPRSSPSFVLGISTSFSRACGIV